MKLRTSSHKEQKYDLVADFLTKEISYRQQCRSEAGWTRWALLVSIAALVWLIFDTIKSEYSVTYILQAFLFVNSLDAMLRLLRTSFPGSLPILPPLSQVRFSRDVFHHEITNIVFMNFRLVSCLAIVYFCFPQVTWFHVLFLFMPILVPISLFNAPFFLMLLNYPIKTALSSKPMPRLYLELSWILLTCMLMGSSYLALHLYWDSSVFCRQELKIAGILYALVFLLDLFLQDESSEVSNSIVVLADIRRRLYLRLFTPEEAFNATNLLLHGRTPSEIIQTSLYEAKELMEAIKKESDLLYLKFQEIMVVFKKGGVSPTSEDKKEAYKLDLEIRSLARRGKKAVAQSYRALNSIQWRLKTLAFSSCISREELKEAVSLIKIEKEKYKKEMQRIVDAMILLHGRRINESKGNKEPHPLEKDQ